MGAITVDPCCKCTTLGSVLGEAATDDVDVMAAGSCNVAALNDDEFIALVLVFVLPVAAEREGSAKLDKLDKARDRKAELDGSTMEDRARTACIVDCCRRNCIRVLIVSNG